MPLSAGKVWENSAIYTLTVSLQSHKDQDLQKEKEKQKFFGTLVVHHLWCWRITEVETLKGYQLVS